jgi:acetyl-CoA carboxylase biotin carboxyl carrier protein
MSDGEKKSPDVFDVDRIRRLVELMEQHDLSEVDLREAGQRIRLARGQQPIAVAYPPTPAAPPTAMPPDASPAIAGPSAAADEKQLVIIKSPMVGTFYARPNPQSEPYIKVGSVVGPETTVCMIEAMKVFNEIPAEVSGRVVAVLVDSDTPVDFGKPLFKIDPRG